jgi:hypothetical protein
MLPISAQIFQVSFQIYIFFGQLDDQLIKIWLSWLLRQWHPEGDCRYCVWSAVRHVSFWAIKLRAPSGRIWKSACIANRRQTAVRLEMVSHKSRLQKPENIAIAQQGYPDHRRFLFVQADISALDFVLNVFCSYFHCPLIFWNSDLWSLLHVASHYVFNILLKDEDIGLLECDAGRWVQVSGRFERTQCLYSPGLRSPGCPLTGAFFFFIGLQGPRVS